jgi:uncharacterized protein (DUF1778 family)
MPISLRIPPKKEKLIARAAQKAGRTKTSFILEAVDEKLGSAESRERRIRNAAGWMSPKDATRLSADLKIFEETDEADWR